MQMDSKHFNIILDHHTTSKNRGESPQVGPLAMSAARRTTLRRILRSPHVSEFPAPKKLTWGTNETVGTDYNQNIKHEQKWKVQFHMHIYSKRNPQKH